MIDVFWTNEALVDLDRIQDFIALDSPAAAYKFAVNVIGCTNRLLAQIP